MASQGALAESANGRRGRKPSGGASLGLLGAKPALASLGAVRQVLVDARGLPGATLGLLGGAHAPRPPIAVVRTRRGAHSSRCALAEVRTRRGAHSSGARGWSWAARCDPGPPGWCALSRPCSWCALVETTNSRCSRMPAAGAALGLLGGKAALASLGALCQVLVGARGLPGATLGLLGGAHSSRPPIAVVRTLRGAHSSRCSLAEVRTRRGQRTTRRDHQ